MKVIVAGSRNFDDFELMKRKLDKILSNQTEITIVSGGARGADRLGEAYAKMHNYTLEIHPADWNKYGRSAGYRRNHEMGDIADALVAFWDGQSRGTKDMIDYMNSLNKPVRVIKFGGTA